MPWPGAAAAAQQERLLTREWLVTNGLGGYASGTVSGVMTRRYHGLLVAALPAPFGRVVMLNHLAEHLRLPDGRKVALGGEERVGSSPELHGAEYLREFRLEGGLPVWQFDVGGGSRSACCCRTSRTPSTSPTRCVAGDGPRPARPAPVAALPPSRSAGRACRSTSPYAVTVVEDRYEITAEGLPPLRLLVCGEGGSLTIEPHRVRQVLYRMEESRGYESAGDWWSPGHFRVWLGRDRRCDARRVHRVVGGDPGARARTRR